ncbi:hypothetical protein E2986_13903 [Frieseomelitta varia]|uniref:Uncharacterized protein n=1 Tax=Frieseomelitta varia TaxID=561572 RepID=A0A833W086_9HYME|nr:hypothetical protein E2986_13903 [Frieseomelitta varia]
MHTLLFFPLGAAACARQTMVPPPTSQAMNHLLVGKSALVSGKNRPLSLPSGAATTKTRPTTLNQNRRDRQGVTLHWKDTKKPKQKPSNSSGTIDWSITNGQLIHTIPVLSTIRIEVFERYSE